MVGKEELERMAENGEFVELPICPHCSELTDARGEFYPCCGKANVKEPEEWVKLIPKEIRKEKSRT